MEDINRIELSGTIGVANFTKVSNQYVVRFSLRVCTSFGMAVHEDVFGCSYWVDSLDECNKFGRGVNVRVSGRMMSNEYIDNEGKTRRFYEVKVQKVQF